MPDYEVTLRMRCNRTLLVSAPNEDAAVDQAVSDLGSVDDWGLVDISEVGNDDAH